MKYYAVLDLADSDRVATLFDLQREAQNLRMANLVIFLEIYLIIQGLLARGIMTGRHPKRGKT